MMSSTLSIRNINKDYEEKPLLRGISLDVNEGEILCLLGRSGSGKSTLLRIIAGIEVADSGSIQWKGNEIRNTPTHQRHFGLMFQDYALFPHLNVAENVAFGLRMQGYPKTQIMQLVKDSLAQVNLAGFEDRRVSDLSGGEQQRVALARALAPSPRFLMLDEPLAALDRALRQQLQEELRTLLHHTRIPTLYVTHDQEEALALGDRLALLNEGQIIQIGTPEEVYRMPKNRWVAQFLGMENFLRAEVTSLHPLTVKTSAGLLHATIQTGRSPAIGEQTEVVLLPTGTSTGNSPEQVNIIRGTVLDSTFRGEHYQLKICTISGDILTFFTPTANEVGSDVSVQFSSENVVCLFEKPQGR